MGFLLSAVDPACAVGGSGAGESGAGGGGVSRGGGQGAQMGTEEEEGRGGGGSRAQTFGSATNVPIYNGATANGLPVRALMVHGGESGASQ